MSNNYDGNIIQQATVGTAAAPGPYVGFENVGDAASTGPRIYPLDDGPNGALTAPAGSIVLQTNGEVWVNTDSVTAWTRLVASGGGTPNIQVDDGDTITFGTGADIVYTANGTSSIVDIAAGAGAGPGVRYADGLALAFGSTPVGTGNISDVIVQWNNGTGTFLVETSNVTDAAAPATGAIVIDTGDNTVSDAAAGLGSGDLTLASGVTDSTDAGGTGGASGDVAIGSGNADSTLGTSGNSGIMTVSTGNSADANSGNIFLTTGTAASGTRGGIVASGAFLTPPIMAADQLNPSAPVLLVFDVPPGASAAIDFVLATGIEITEVVVRKKGGAGGVGDTIQVQTGAGTAVTNAMDLNIADNLVVRPTTLTNATVSFAGGATLRLDRVEATDAECQVAIFGFAIA